MSYQATDQEAGYHKEYIDADKAPAELVREGMKKYDCND